MNASMNARRKICMDSDWCRWDGLGHGLAGVSDSKELGI